MKQYHKLLNTILESGTYKAPARENMPGTTSLFGYQMRFNLTDGFPLITTKKMYWKGVVIELLWFLRGDTNIKFLLDNGVNIWNQDAYQYYCKLCKQWKENPVSMEDFLIKTKEEDKIFNYKFGDCGRQYGEQWRNYGALPEYQIQPISKIERNGDGSGGSLLKATWDGMMERCYNPNASHFNVYGGRGIYVSDEWHVFKTFEKDVQNLEGWEDKINNWDNWQLDKDFTGDGFCYSKDTCKWVSRETNCSSSKLTYILEKDGVDYKINNLRKFARENKITHGNLSRLVTGERDMAYGYRLKNILSSYKGKDQLKELLFNLKNNPDSRRHIITAWNPNDLDNLALHPCHAMFQFNCRKLSEDERMRIWHGKTKGLHIGLSTYDKTFELELDKQNIPKFYLDCQLYQRSADVVLGVPFNIASYALLTEIIAKICNMIPGELIHTFGDVHIYDNHMDAVKEQLQRTPKQLPELDIHPGILDYDLEKFEYSMFTLKNYDPYPKLESETELSTGLKK